MFDGLLFAFFSFLDDTLHLQDVRLYTLLQGLLIGLAVNSLNQKKYMNSVFPVAEISFF